MRISIIILTLLLSFNATAYALEYDVLGVLGNGCEIGVGKVQKGKFSHRGTISVNFKNHARQCSGTFSMDPSTADSLISVKGMRGTAQLSCNDGSVIDAQPVAEGLRRGYGKGTIAYGGGGIDKFFFVFATPGQDVEKLLSELLKRESNQCLSGVE
jgi:hypothetical protein